MKPLRLCLVLRYFTVGGLERVVIALANSLIDRGIDVRVIVLAVSRRNGLVSELHEQVDLVILSGTLLERCKDLHRLTKGYIVHLHFGDGRIQPLVRFCLLGRPVIVTYHSVYTHKRTWLLNRVDQVACLVASRVIAVSEAAATFCNKDVHIPLAKIRVIPNGIAGSLRGTKREYPVAGPFYGVCVASLYPHKNQMVLLEGIRNVRDRGLDVRLRIIGDGPRMAELYQQCVRLSLRPFIEWYGAIWRKDIVEPLLQSSAFFCSASLYEGMPLSVLEAMANALPLVLSDIPSHRETAVLAAYYFDPNSADSFGSAVSEIVTTPQRLKQLGDASSSMFVRHSLEETVSKHLSLYEDLRADALK